MKQTLIKQIQQEMAGVLNNAQRLKLKEVLEHCFFFKICQYKTFC